MADVARPRLQVLEQPIVEFSIDIDPSIFARKVTVFNLTVSANQAGTGYLDVSIRMAQTDVYVTLLSTLDGQPIAFDLSAPDMLVLDGLDIGSIKLTPRDVVGITSLQYCLGGIHDE